MQITKDFPDRAPMKYELNIDYEKYKSVFDSSMKMLPLYQESLENAVLITL